jgi:hypothetical protein
LIINNKRLLFNKRFFYGESKMLRNLTHIITSLLIVSCATLPIKKEIADGKFRIENFQSETGKQREYVYLMCHRKSESGWTQARQYDAGEHSLWVKAVVSDRDFPSAEKNAFVRFDMDFQEGGNYLLNRKIDDDNISVWITNKDTGLQVSEIITEELKRPLIIEDQLRKKQCSEGSV